VNQLISARDDAFPLSAWEEQVVETLASSNAAEGWLAYSLLRPFVLLVLPKVT